ncbi:hypothetical protein [Haloarcula sediminis]|uniref:hypothetical protein n=1 Tax=Haloarcula sediminis TaxID=3111777 RepID=UPI002D781297|nr:hypothetical protein [Haloarcula sp. CK38]
MSTPLQRFVPGELGLFGAVTNAIAVAATIYVLDGSLSYAVAAAAGFLVLHLATDLADAAVGDYAGNALFGLLILAATGYAVTLTTPLWIPALGAALGGWFLLDGVQHLRHGVTRDEVGVPYRHEGGVLTALPKALLVRLAEPILLSRRSP